MRHTVFIITLDFGAKWMVPIQWHAQLGCEHWALQGPPWSKTVGFCDLLGTSYAPVSKILSVKSIAFEIWGTTKIGMRSQNEF